MPSVSKSQQRLMGMVHAYKKGDLDLKDLSPSLVDKIKDIADGHRRKTGDRRRKTKGLSDTDALHYASTKHKGLPEKVKENLITRFDGFLNEEKRQKGEKLKFEDWWKKSYEKTSDYWVEKKEIKQGYQTGDLTHYKERKMRSKYNKYLKRKK